MQIGKWFIVSILLCVMTGCAVMKPKLAPVAGLPGVVVQGRWAMKKGIPTLTYVQDEIASPADVEDVARLLAGGEKPDKNYAWYNPASWPNWAKVTAVAVGAAVVAEDQGWLGGGGSSSQAAAVEPSKGGAVGIFDASGTINNQNGTINFIINQGSSDENANASPFALDSEMVE